VKPNNPPDSGSVGADSTNIEYIRPPEPSVHTDYSPARHDDARVVRLARVALGLDEYHFARAMGTTRGTVVKWESGESRPWQMARLLLVALVRLAGYRELGEITLDEWARPRRRRGNRLRRARARARQVATEVETQLHAEREVVPCAESRESLKAEVSS